MQGKTTVIKEETDVDQNIHKPGSKLLAESAEEYRRDCKMRRLEQPARRAQQVANEFLQVTNLAMADDVTRRDIVRFCEALCYRGLSKSTVRSKLSQLQSWLRFAGVDSGKFLQLPSYEQKLLTFYTPAEIRAILGAANSSEAIAFRMSLELGLREGEIRYAEFTDVFFDSQVFRVRGNPHFGPMADAVRDIPIPDNLLSRLKEWRELHPEQQLIVPAPDGRPNRYLLRQIKQVANRAGLACGVCRSCIKSRECSEFTVHKLRRTHIASLLKAGLDIRTVMAQAGIACIQSTLRYLNPMSCRDAQVAITAIDWEWSDLT